ncbi:DNA/RNA non-specific endonuclease [Alistipes sp.]|uniref:DNA/RNA non-specific endonuclease n=1 Tax=Alistipes sp. TaxID=1872444 RepID=UPI003AEF5340
MKRFYLSFREALRRLGCLRAWLPCAALLALSCSRSVDDDAYAALATVPFDFSETAAETNVVSVLSNTSWQVCWTPATAAAVVEPASGEGNGVFRIVDMPRGATLRFDVCTAAGPTGRPVAVTRRAEAGGYTLSLTPGDVLHFDPNAPAANVIAVGCNTKWVAAPSSPSLVVTPLSGSGDGTIAVTDIPAGESHTLTVTAGEGAEAVVRRITVTREAAAQTRTLYYDDFDRTDIASGWADAGGWEHAAGDGAGSVGYAVRQVRVYNNAYGSAGRYPAASGCNYMQLYFDYDAYFLIRDIAVQGEQRFTLSLGAAFEAANCTIAVAGDKGFYKELAYTGAPAYNTWQRISVDFSIAAPTERLSILITPVLPKQSSGVKFDDVRLATSASAGQLLDLERPTLSYAWPELPERPADGAGYVIATCYAPTVASRQQVRNYTCCYDIRRHQPLWIAHPQHRCYSEGGVARSDNPWAPSPEMTDAEQAIIYPLGGGTNAVVSGEGNDGYQWTRGHMLASSYRGGAGSELNTQTFRSGNIAAQASADGSVFQMLWAAAESRILDQYVCQDTLYCVSGAYFGDEGKTAMDASWINASNWVGHRAGYAKTVVVPTHFYKLLLRTKNGHTGKAIQQCRPEELQAVGFWFENADAGASTAFGTAQMKSVQEIERLTGQTFFPEVDAAVKAQYNAADWDF